MSIQLALGVSEDSRTTIGTLLARKRERQKIAVLTCYDFLTARLMERAGIDVILVGDTYGEVCLGYDTTLPVKLDHLLTICEAVRRGAPRAYLIGDMPYLTYQVSPERAIENAGRFMAEAGCDCVKVEVDRRLASTVEALSRATIPVMAHLGLKPQSIHRLGGYRAQGRTAAQAREIIEDARIMEQAGAVALLLEAVPVEVAATVTERTALPVIGCATGPGCDGHVMVIHDILGFGGGHPPRSTKTYVSLDEVLSEAFRGYHRDIVAGAIPADTEGVYMSDEELRKLRKLLEQ